MEWQCPGRGLSEHPLQPLQSAGAAAGQAIVLFAVLSPGRPRLARWGQDLNTEVVNSVRCGRLSSAPCSFLWMLL